jgi:hypothetical protein
VVGSILTTPEPVYSELSMTKLRGHNPLGKLGLRRRGQMAYSAQSIFRQHLDGFKLEPGYATLSLAGALCQWPKLGLFLFACPHCFATW